MQRRQFIKNSSLSLSAVSLLSPLGSIAEQTTNDATISENKALLRIGICTDVHKDVIHDADRRLQLFVEEMAIKKPDFIIQMGDFCRPYDYNRGFLDIWNSFAGPRYHVLGNHDMDGGFSFEQVMEYWQGRGPYYSFDEKGFHFIILNGNEIRPGATVKGYPRYISEVQRAWLAEDLDKTSLPVIVFCHQALDVDVMNSIEEATIIRLIFERANQRAGKNKVRLVFSGHHHKDFHNEINGIQYVQINSMSYFWLGDKYQTVRYSADIDKNFPYLKYTAPYEDPLWAFLTIHKNGDIDIKGKRTDFVGPSPEELGMPKFERIYPVVPHISDRKFSVG